MALLPTAPYRNRGEPTEAVGATYLTRNVIGSVLDFDSSCLGSSPSGSANCQGMGGIDPPGGRRGSITALMTSAGIALTIRAKRPFSFLLAAAGAPRQPFPKV